MPTTGSLTAWLPTSRFLQAPVREFTITLVKGVNAITVGGAALGQVAFRPISESGDPLPNYPDICVKTVVNGSPGVDVGPTPCGYQRIRSLLPGEYFATAKTGDQPTFDLLQPVRFTVVDGQTTDVTLVFSLSKNASFGVIRTLIVDQDGNPVSGACVINYADANQDGTPDPIAIGHTICDYNLPSTGGPPIGISDGVVLFTLRQGTWIIAISQDHQTNTPRIPAGYVLGNPSSVEVTVKAGEEVTVTLQLLKADPLVQVVSCLIPTDGKTHTEFNVLDRAPDAVAAASATTCDSPIPALNEIDVIFGPFDHELHLDQYGRAEGHPGTGALPWSLFIAVDIHLDLKLALPVQTLNAIPGHSYLIFLQFFVNPKDAPKPSSPTATPTPLPTPIAGKTGDLELVLFDCGGSTASFKVFPKPNNAAPDSTATPRRGADYAPLASNGKTCASTSAPVSLDGAKPVTIKTGTVFHNLASGTHTLQAMCSGVKTDVPVYGGTSAIVLLLDPGVCAKPVKPATPGAGTGKGAGTGAAVTSLPDTGAGPSPVHRWPVLQDIGPLIVLLLIVLALVQRIGWEPRRRTPASHARLPRKWTAAANHARKRDRF